MFCSKLFKYVFIIPVLTLVLLLGLNTTALAFTNPSTLAQKVRNAISTQYLRNFYVTANSKGIVTIEGQVNRLYNKYNVFDIADRVKGVNGINDFIMVNAPMLPSNMIRDGIENNINIDNSIVEPNRIKVRVTNDGIAILSGTVSYKKEKLQAETVASWQKGVIGVVNDIRVLPHYAAVSNKNLKHIVKDVIKNNFSLNKRIHFTVNNGVVTLEGHSNNDWTLDNLKKDCLKIEGVKKVINDIKPKQETYSNFI